MTLADSRQKRTIEQSYLDLTKKAVENFAFTSSFYRDYLDKGN